MNCIKCGSQLPDGSAFCSRCGAGQSGEPVAHPGSGPSLNAPAAKNVFSEGTALYIMSGIFAVLYAFIYIIFYIDNFADYIEHNWVEAKEALIYLLCFIYSLATLAVGILLIIFSNKNQRLVGVSVLVLGIVYVLSEYIPYIIRYRGFYFLDRLLSFSSLIYLMFIASIILTALGMLNIIKSSKFILIFSGAAYFLFTINKIFYLLYEILRFDELSVFSIMDILTAAWVVLLAGAVAYKDFYSANRYINIGVHILLCILTFGVWYFIWIYRTTAYFNMSAGVQKFRPVSSMLLCMFVPFYSIYWFYKNGQRADIAANSMNMNLSNICALCTIFSVFIPIVACIILQDRINNLCRPAAGMFSTPIPPKYVQSHQDLYAQIDNLKKLKDLLDSGAITQEEFDAKKKQIMNL